MLLLVCATFQYLSRHLKISGQFIHVAKHPLEGAFDAKVFMTKTGFDICASVSYD